MALQIRMQTRVQKGLSALRLFLWHVLLLSANLLFFRYICWRVNSFWTAPELNILSPVLMVLEALCFIGFALYTVNLWDLWVPAPKPPCIPPTVKTVDIFITTYSEKVGVVLPSIRHARAVDVPAHLKVRVVLLDDGNRRTMRWLAAAEGIDYITRTDNVGFKAGNLQNALRHSQADLFVICDADTHLAPAYLRETEPFFRDPSVAWVQVPHRFRDTPIGRLPWPLHWITWNDPMYTDPQVFFGVLQNGRNAGFASFCCGAGSIHSRQAVALGEFEVAETPVRDAAGRAMRPVRAQPPFAHHVSEDIYTSYRLHFRPGPRLKSVLLDRPLATMSAVQDLNAWTIQNFKYAAGTLDIFFREIGRFRLFDRPRARLYYLMTFWSYLSLTWMPVMAIIPILSALTGWPLIDGGLWAFLNHFLPFFIACEAVVMIGTGRFGVLRARVAYGAVMFLAISALRQVIARQKLGFQVTPKGRSGCAGWGVLVPHAVFVTALLGCAVLVGSKVVTGPVYGGPTEQNVIILFWLLYTAGNHMPFLMSIFTVPEGVS